MTRSRARLVATDIDGSTRLTALGAGAPQRWSRRPGAETPWAEATHQLLGDGVFGGDALLTTITARTGAHVLVDAVAATPLRGGGPSLTATRLRAEAGSTLVYAPGALIPHAEADHTSSLVVAADERARVLVVTAIAGGRSGMGESDAFGRIVLRTTITVAGRRAFAEQVAIEGGDFARAAGGAAIVVTAFALGEWAPATAAWWSVDLPGVTGGASALRSSGVAYRGLCGSYGALQAFTERVCSMARSQACEIEFAASRNPMPR